MVMSASPTRTPPASPATAAPSKSKPVGWQTRAGRRFAGVATRLLVWIGLGVLVVAVLYPLLWMVFSSFKSNQEVFASPWGLPGELRWGNFGKAGSAGVVRYFVNSVLVTSASILTTVLLSAFPSVERFSASCSVG
jgi:raffinose/stachyose/melibiose transport system permease protein